MRGIHCNSYRANQGPSGQSTGTQRVAPLGPLGKMSLHDGLWWRLSPPYHQPHHRPASFRASTARLCATSDRPLHSPAAHSHSPYGSPRGMTLCHCPSHPPSHLLLFLSPPLISPPPLRSNGRVVLSGSPPPSHLHSVPATPGPASRPPHPSLPSMAAAPPGIILVIKMPGSSGAMGVVDACNAGSPGQNFPAEGSGRHGLLKQKAEGRVSGAPSTPAPPQSSLFSQASEGAMAGWGFVVTNLADSTLC